MIDGDENKEWYKVTLDEFVQFVEQRSEWLYQKIQAIHQRYDDCIDSHDSQIAEHEAWIAEEELHSQIKEEELTVTQKELQDMKECLAMAEQDWDIFANSLVWYVIEETSRIVTNSDLDNQASTKQKSAKIPDLLTLTDDKEPQFEDWLLLMIQKLKANQNHFDTPQLQQAYVISHCNGKAQRHITS